MLQVELRPARPLMNPDYDSSYDKLQLYEVAFSSRSFLYNQVSSIKIIDLCFKTRKLFLHIPTKKICEFKTDNIYSLSSLLVLCQSSLVFCIARSTETFMKLQLHLLLLLLL